MKRIVLLLLVALIVVASVSVSVGVAHAQTPPPSTPTATPIAYSGRLPTGNTFEVVYSWTFGEMIIVALILAGLFLFSLAFAFKVIMLLWSVR